jgi:uncharacterized protein
MKKTFNPQSLDVQAFAKAGLQLEGETPLREFERLAQDCAGEISGQVQWLAQGALAPDASGKESVWLHLQVQATVPLTCQRCLNPVPTELELARDFRFVTDEDTAIQEDEDSQEDLLVLETNFDLLALIEDELLMSLPLVPMHQGCVGERVPTSKEEDAILSATKPNPFAVLASLKTPKH